MENSNFHHALQIKESLCIGCSHCMDVCPTEAIRVRNGKALLIDNKCVDCGECFRVCPVSAIIIDHDDFSKIFRYKYRVALVPMVFVGQFSEDVARKHIYSALLETGFTHVQEVEEGVEVLQQNMLIYQASHTTKPLISSFCPAIVRLIQVKFPGLVDNIMLLKPPLDVSALYIRKKLLEQGAAEDEIGIFYITPCAAKIAAIKSPVGEDYSSITGVINMDFIFNKVYQNYKHSKADTCTVPEIRPLSAPSVKWSLTHGEAARASGRALAIDEIHNVIEFLEKIESDEITSVDFLELRACDESCAGGVLTVVNRFLTAERLNKLAASLPQENGSENLKELEAYKEYLEERISIGKVNPRSMLKLDENITVALKKMDMVREILPCLPMVDCGACGAPNCQALAQDIVQGESDLEHCFFVQKRMENNLEYSSEDSLKKLTEIWGKEKFGLICKRRNKE
jgi:iron only hydrogenase large subunit-like protein